METTLTAVEATATIDEHNQLKLDHPLPISGPVRVRIIVLYPTSDEWDEAQWLKAAAHNPAFEFLANPEEDIYSLADGAAFHDEA